MGMICRLPGWESRLSSYLIAQFGKPFKWGQNDCALFTAGAVHAMTGHDLARGFRGYRTEQAGLKKLRDKGFYDHEAFVASRFDETPLTLLMNGDLITVQQGDSVALSVFSGSGIHALTPTGLQMVPFDRGVKGYKIPCPQ